MGGSETNCVSMQLVQDLKLHTQDYPNPYKLRWLDSKAEGFVKKQCLINFSIGSYHDKVLCDVLSMNACHILLGRPWQHDRHSIHNGFTNIYTIKHNGKMKDLIPLHPCKIIATTTTQNNTSCVHNKRKGKKTPVHLFTKKTHENQNQQQPPALKSLEDKASALELLKPLHVDDIAVTKLHQKSPSEYCDENVFHFMEDRKASYDLNEGAYYKEIQKREEFVCLSAKKISETQVQQQYQSLKPLNSELPNTISVDAIKISKLNLENSSTFCDVSGF